ncbi:pentapeptide repeat-containing protein [Acrocarpospora macrocephala]|uniref:pentapeptide repeat-containing protein n=1 Tax=Acrocarpospora macrocephala TaxID=150177 RepID=UPI0012D35821|nr:pentapeptide repeat-containing protein [Acrocarpospora macrocephala]
MRLPVLVTVTVIAIIAVFLGSLAFLPTWLVQHSLGDHTASALAAADRLRAENDVRSTLLQGLGGLLALGGIALGAVVTMRQVSTSREGQFIDLFTKAIEHLASEKTSVRHGGVYAMEQIAETAPHYRGHVAALLASFIRQQAPWPPSEPAHTDAERASRHGELRDDVAGAIAVLARRTMVEPGYSIALEQVDLRGADLTGFDLSRFCFVGANLDNALLAGCDLTHTTFSNASLRGADLTGARLTEADLRGADLTGADLADVVDLETAMTDGTTKGLPVTESDPPPAARAK